jgi:hypothetical protein
MTAQPSPPGQETVVEINRTQNQLVEQQMDSVNNDMGDLKKTTDQSLEILKRMTNFPPVPSTREQTGLNKELVPTRRP